MKLVVGLGNPGREYEGTRHNVGWWVLDHLADVWHMQGWRKDGDARVSAGDVAGQKVRLVKPLTYMNLSGAVLRPYLRRESWSFEKDLLVVLDDAALPLGTFRFRARGSHGGHNGLRSIEGALGSRDYARLRVGIGPPPARRGGQKADLAKFVLAPLSRAERAVIEELRQELAEAIETWVREGVDKTMNVFNRSRETESND
ncbi:MAG TPA: aminoacyl-tRNA hydrolase [Gemmatimonadaceae bacterium]